METQVNTAAHDNIDDMPWTGSEPFSQAGSHLRLAIVTETPEIRAELSGALEEIGAGILFDLPASAPPLDVTAAVEREHPDVIFVETALLPKAPADWIAEIRRGGDLPLVVAVHTAQDTDQMIRALRAGASEFLSAPLRRGLYEAMDRTGAILESRRAASAERGKVLGFLSAKGGCGASTIACYTAAALSDAALAPAGGTQARCLVADLDYQASSISSIFRVSPVFHTLDALEQIRRVNNHSWKEIVVPVTPYLDVLGGAAAVNPPSPEQWRIEAFFRFTTRNYRYICVDLGRHLTPANWFFLQNVEELFLVTGPDVLSLYQTRTILQMLASRGYDKGRVRLILNLNQSGPVDFWKESIEQMFEMPVYFTVPNDQELGARRSERFEFHPGDSTLGKHMMKLAAKVAGINIPKSSGIGFFRRVQPASSG